MKTLAIGKHPNMLAMSIHPTGASAFPFTASIVLACSLNSLGVCPELQWTMNKSRKVSSNCGNLGLNLTGDWSERQV